jgi:nicotinamidase-related amidase
MRTALVIIDVQNGILQGLDPERAGDTAAALDAVVARLRALIARARESAVPVIYVQHEGSPGHRLEPGGPGWEIRPEIAPAPGEPVVRKRACDAFFETTLASHLATLGADRLVVAGCMTQYCVDTTVRRAVTLGYDVTLVADGHMTAGAAGLTFEQIIAHHNHLLDGFDAGDHAVSVIPAAGIVLR